MRIQRSCLVALLLATGLTAWPQKRSFLPEDIERLEPHGVKASVVDYRGKTAIKLTEASSADEATIAILKDTRMRDGTIEAEVSGAPGVGASESARGFVGIAFRVEPDAKHYEYIYLRPTNGRAQDQVRRNHSVQYASHPDFPFDRLRKEEPEKYESYVHLEPGVYTKMRIVVSNQTANLYVNGASQPALVVNDLKLGAKEGNIALWIGPGTEAYFSQITLSPAK